MGIALTIVIIVAIAAIAWVVIRKLPQISSLHISESPKERLQRLKQHIIVSRVLRKFGLARKKIVSPETWQRISYLVKESYAKLKMLEDTYKTQTAGAKMKLLLSRGSDSIIDDPEVAERCFLDVITIDPRNLSAYEGLSRIYLGKGAFKEAIEVLEFLMKLNPASSGRYMFELAAAFQKRNELKEAWKYATRATEEEPGNPKYLDFLVELAILEGHKKEGQKYLEKLREVNPENAKIEEFRERIASIG